MSVPEDLSEAVKRHGYAKKKKIKLYWQKLEVVSDPVKRQGDDVFVSAKEEGASVVKQVQVPRNIVTMAKAVEKKSKG
jgi:hypothetical protein